MEDEVKLEALELLDRLKRHYLPELHTLMNDCNYVKNKLAVNNPDIPAPTIATFFINFFPNI